MAAPKTLSRKEFFRRFLRPSTHSTRPRETAHGASVSVGDDLPVAFLESDFPPDLLAEEAVRLGLDPNSADRNALLRAVYRRMQEQRVR